VTRQTADGARVPRGAGPARPPPFGPLAVSPTSNPLVSSSPATPDDPVRARVNRRCSSRPRTGRDSCRSITLGDDSGPAMRLTVGVGPKFPDAPPSIFPGAPSGARQGRSLARLARNLPGTAGVRTRRVSSAARAKRETLERPAPPAEASPGTQLPVPTPGEPRAPGRLWSSLDASMKHQPGSLVGATALVAGTTVGAGVLALPTVASTAGFVPSTTTLLVCCGASIATGMVRAPRPPPARAPPPGCPRRGRTPPRPRPRR